MEQYTTIERMIFKAKFKVEEFNANDFNDWVKENEGEAYSILLTIAKKLNEKKIDVTTDWARMFEDEQRRADVLQETVKRLLKEKHDLLTGLIKTLTN